MIERHVRRSLAGASSARALDCVGVAAVLVVWIVASGVVVWRARSSTESGLNQLTTIRDELSPAELLAGKGN